MKSRLVKANVVGLSDEIKVAELIKLGEMYDQLSADALRDESGDTVVAIANLDQLFLKDVANLLEIDGDLDAVAVFDDATFDDCERYMDAAGLISEVVAD